MLYEYQLDLKSKIYQAWQNKSKNILCVLATGGGKTVLMGEIAKEFNGYGLFIAHRHQLIEQISLQLARQGIYHDIINPKSGSLRKDIIKRHYDKFGKSYISERVNWWIGGVDTVIRMPHDPRWKKINLLFTDEGHHLLRTNKWGKVFEFMPYAKLLGVTATPWRADGKALDVYDTLIEGITTRELIDKGFLTDYRLICPQSVDLDLSNIEISQATGDYNSTQLKRAMMRSKTIVGNVVQEYLKHARGKLGITFAIDISEAYKIRNEFKAAGVPAEVITAQTPLSNRVEILRKYERREILELVNVDIFGEGFDLPAIEVVSLVRRTASLSLFMQQCGRSLRVVVNPNLQKNWGSYTDQTRKQLIENSKKPYALIIDHVGNVLQHHLPDIPRINTLTGRKAADYSDIYKDVIKLRVCLNVTCMKTYERILVCCPFCNEAPPLPQKRSDPIFVDGDLELLTQETLNNMRNEINRIDHGCYVPNNVEPYIKTKIIRNHLERQCVQRELRDTIALWAGKNNKYSDRVNYKRFYFKFNMSVLDAMVLNVRDAEVLKNKIIEEL